MAPKQKKTMKKLADALKEIHIGLGEAPEASPGAATNSGTVIDTNPAPLSKWPKLRLKVPDIFLHKPVDFQQHVHKLLSMGIKFKQPYLCKYYIKITCLTMNDHRALVQYFEKKKLPFNTFGNPAKRKMKVVIRGLPKDIDLNNLKSELKSFSIPIVRVHKMQRLEYKKNSTSLILAVVPYNDDGTKLLQAKKIMGHDVKMEPPISKTKQCHRCQMWGHTQRYCHGKVKCVKCAGEHISKMCERDPDKEPPKCANCGGEHTASFRKCPCCPDSQVHKRSQLIKRFGTETQHGAADLVTLQNCDTLYRNVSYDPNYKLPD